jgi:RNA polymerase sigma-70 factor (ECF subfamily)
MSDLRRAPDDVLAARSADGDAAAFGMLVRRHAPFLLAFATRLTGSRADADDCVQDALITAWQKLPELEDPAKVRAWMTTIVSRSVTTRLRSQHPSDSLDGVDVVSEEPGPERAAIAASQLDALQAALATLTPEQRSVWVLKEVGGASYEEIAEQLETSVSTVRGRLARARQALLERMEEWR